MNSHEAEIGRAALQCVRLLTKEIRDYAASAAAFAIAPFEAPPWTDQWYHEAGFKDVLRKVATDLFELVEDLPEDELFEAVLAK